ncbi:MAG: CBS domain-containing protein [Candidatus Micrarchaeota archaeon]|nr:CBS domain-containing protein [Candidatus Micrarchaeota archaeon]
MVKVKEIMKSPVITASPDTNMSVISKMMTNNKIGSVVFVDDNRPVDIVTTDDIVGMVSAELDPKKTTIKDLRKSKRKLLTVSPDDNVLNVAKKMIKSGVKRFPVVDKNGKLVGIISEKEILLVSPELIEILTEKLKEKIEAVPGFVSPLSGICEACGQYSDELKNINGRWVCTNCQRDLV